MITGEHKSSLNDTAIKSLLAAAEAVVVVEEVVRGFSTSVRELLS